MAIKKIILQKRWKDIPCSQIGRINTVKMIILSKAINRFNAIPIKLPVAFFIELEFKNFFKICIETQKTLNCQLSLEKEKRILRKQVPLFQTKLQNYSKQKSIVLVQKWKYRSREQYRNLKINPSTYGPIIYDKGAKNTQWRKDTLFNTWH